MEIKEGLNLNTEMGFTMFWENWPRMVYCETLSSKDHSISLRKETSGFTGKKAKSHTKVRTSVRTLAVDNSIIYNKTTEEQHIPRNSKEKIKVWAKGYTAIHAIH